MTPELIIFDCDGVLVDTEPLTEQLIQESLEDHGLPLNLGDIRHLFTGGTMDSVEAEARTRGAHLPQDWQSGLYEEMFQRLDKGVNLIPGILELIEKAENAKIATAVASNAPYAKMRRSLGPSGLWDRMEPNIFSREDSRPKPDPEMIFRAMAQAGVSKQRTVFIDDSPSGSRAGIAAGVRTFGLALRGQAADLEAVGAEVVHSIAEIEDLLGL